MLKPLIEPGFRLALAMLHEPQAAEDAVQEASFVAWRKLGRIREQSRLRPWFLGVQHKEAVIDSSTTTRHIGAEWGASESISHRFVWPLISGESHAAAGGTGWQIDGPDFSTTFVAC